MQCMFFLCCSVLTWLCSTQDELALWLLVFGELKLFSSYGNSGLGFFLYVYPEICIWSPHDSLLTVAFLQQAEKEGGTLEKKEDTFYSSIPALRAKRVRTGESPHY